MGGWREDDIGRGWGDREEVVMRTLRASSSGDLTRISALFSCGIRKSHLLNLVLSVECRGEKNRDRGCNLEAWCFKCRLPHHMA